MALKRPTSRKKAKSLKTRERSIDSRDEAAHRRGQCTWSPRLELDGASIPWDVTLWESQRGQTSYLIEALQQPLALQHGRAPNYEATGPLHVIEEGSRYGKTKILPCSGSLFYAHLFVIYVLMILPLLLCRSPNKSSWPRSG